MRFPYVILGCANYSIYLEAEFWHNPEGLMRLALHGNIEFKARMVAGARFELTTFRL